MPARNAAIVAEVIELFDRPHPRVTVDGDEIAFADAVFSVLDADAARRLLDGAPQLEREDEPPVPALDHRTPREAAGVKKLRAKLVALVESNEIQAARQAKEGEGFDASFLRTELGLRST